MLLFVLVLFSWKLARANIALSPITPNKIILTTETNKGQRSLFNEVPPLPNVNPNLTHYDLSLSDDDNHPEYQQYIYKDSWWVTIRDLSTVFTTPPLPHLVIPTRPVSEENNKTIVRLKHNFNIIDMFKRPATKGIDNMIGYKARAAAMKRNKQIQRMQLELEKKNVTKATTVVKLDAKGVKAVTSSTNTKTLNKSLNFSYKKIIESLKLNLDKNEMDGLGKLNLKDIITFQGAIEPPPSAQSINNTVATTTGFHRQGPQRETIPPYVTADDPPKPDYRPPWMPQWTTTERTTRLINDLKRQMETYRLGYFSIFMAQTADSISRKSDDAVRKLTRSLEREVFRIYTEEQYLLSFGNTFMKWFEQMLISVSVWPSDFVKHHAMILGHKILSRNENIADELNKIIDFIDAIFEEDEGNALFKVNELIDKYPNTTETAPEVIKAITKTVFAPFRRLSGSFTRQVLVDSINSYIEKILSLPASLEVFANVGEKRVIARRFSNRTRFVVVGRDNSTKTKETNKTQNSVHSDKFSQVEKKDNKYRGDSKSNKTKKERPFYKQQSVISLRSTPKLSTTERKQHKKNDFEQKHLKVYKKYTEMTRKVHKKQKKIELLDIRNYSKQKRFSKIKGYETYSKMKGKKLKDKLLYSKSETDSDKFYNNDDSDETYYSDDHQSSGTTIEERESFSAISSTFSKKKFYSMKSTGLFNNRSTHKTARPRIITETTKIKFDVLGSMECNFEVNLKKEDNQVKKFSDTTLTNPSVRKKVSMGTKYRIYTKNHIKSNKKHAIHISAGNFRKPTKSSTIKFSTSRPAKDKHTAPTPNVIGTGQANDDDDYDVYDRSTIAKNKIVGLSSYSDEEDILKFQISDAMRHDKKFVKPLRRSYHLRNKVKKGLDGFSSYSNEEVVLKSKIYKAFGFTNFSEPTRILRANDDDKVKAKNVLNPKFRPINEVSSYSDEENILRDKLKIS